MSLDIYLKAKACEHCGRGDETVWQRNITYNLSTMWHLAGVPFDRGIEGMPAKELEPALRRSLEMLRAEPDEYRRLNPANGWGSYEGLVEAVESMLYAVGAYPDAIVETWR